MVDISCSESSDVKKVLPSSNQPSNNVKAVKTPNELPQKLKQDTFVPSPKIESKLFSWLDRIFLAKNNSSPKKNSVDDFFTELEATEKIDKQNSNVKQFIKDLEKAHPNISSDGKIYADRTEALLVAMRRANHIFLNEGMTGNQEITFGKPYNHSRFDAGYLQIDGSFYFCNPSKYKAPVTISYSMGDITHQANASPLLGTLTLMHVNAKPQMDFSLIDIEGVVLHLQLDGSVYDTGKTKDGKIVREPKTIIGKMRIEDKAGAKKKVFYAEYSDKEMHPLTPMFNKFGVYPLIDKHGFYISLLEQYKDNEIFIQPTIDGSLSIHVNGKHTNAGQENGVTYILDRHTGNWSEDPSQASINPEPYTFGLIELMANGTVEYDQSNPFVWQIKGTESNVYVLSSNDGRIWSEGTKNDRPAIIFGKSGKLSKQDFEEIKSQRLARIGKENLELASKIDDIDLDIDLPKLEAQLKCILKSDLEVAFSPSTKEEKELLAFMKKAFYYVGKLEEVEKTGKLIYVQDGKKVELSERNINKIAVNILREYGDVVEDIYEEDAPGYINWPDLDYMYNNFGRVQSTSLNIKNVDKSFLKEIEPYMRLLDNYLGLVRVKIFMGRICGSMNAQSNYELLDFLNNYRNN